MRNENKIIPKYLKGLGALSRQNGVISILAIKGNRGKAPVIYIL